MKPQELRLGNYVNVTNKNQSPFKIGGFTFITKDDCKIESDKITALFDFSSGKHPLIEMQVHPLTWYLKDLTPIKLTEDWLLKFKFRYVKSKKCWISFDGLKIWNSGTKNKPYYYHLNDELMVNIDYVHTLQNFNYAVTGEELTLKNEV